MKLIIFTIKLLIKQTISFTKISSKIYKSETYEKVINNLLYSKQLKDKVDKELFNLKLHNI